jgi:hypothetical protein
VCLCARVGQRYVVRVGKYRHTHAHTLALIDKHLLALSLSLSLTHTHTHTVSGNLHKLALAICERVGAELVGMKNDAGESPLHMALNAGLEEVAVTLWSNGCS